MTADTARNDRDRSLVKKACTGDEQAYELLILLYQSRITNLLRQYFPGDEQTVEDVLQEVFIKAWRALCSFKGNSAFYTWLYSIAVNTGRNHLANIGRKRHREMVLDEDEIEQIEDHSVQLRPDNRYEDHDYRIRVQAVMRALPEAVRELLHLWSEGFAYRDISDMTGIPLNTVRTRIFRGKKLLQKHLSERALLAPQQAPTVA